MTVTTKCTLGTNVMEDLDMEVAILERRRSDKFQFKMKYNIKILSIDLLRNVGRRDIFAPRVGSARLCAVLNNACPPFV